MATVLTTTQTDVLAPPTLAPLARDHTNGRLYTLARTGTDTLTVYRSTDLGGSWGSFAAFTHTGLQEWSRLIVDRNGYAHLSYRVGTGSSDTVWYKRLNLTAATWATGVQVTATDANSGSIGSRTQGTDIAVVRWATGAYAIAVCIAHTYTNNTYGMIVNGVSISTAGVITPNNGLILNKRTWYDAGTAPGRSGVACEVEHTGDGLTSQTPHLWVAWGRTSLRMVKLSWNGSAWSGPSNFQVIRSGITAQDYAGGRWDGKQWLMPIVSPDDATAVRVYQRNQANTLTSNFDSPTHPAGNVRNFSISYDSATKNIRVYAVGTSSTLLYFTDYNRAGTSWSSWATVSGTAVLGSAGQEWGVKAGGTTWNARHDVVTVHSGAPNTVTHTAQTASSTPDTPTWDTSAVPYYNGGAADTAATLTLDWNFTDPDPGQGQGSYALSRQIGAGALSYWNAGTTTWGVTEVQNGSATTQVTLAAAWGAGTDAAHSYKVKVWDSVGTPSAGYSAALVIVASVKVNPTIATPTAAQVLNNDSVTVTWTVAEQTAYRVRLLTNPGGQQVHDSGFVSSTALTYTVPEKLANGTGWTVELTTKNLEGLASTAQTRAFTVVYAPPPAMRSTYTPAPLSGYLTVTPVTLTPVGTQPAIVGADLYRRPAITATINANPTMAGNVTGWFVGGGGTAGTLTYSTAQFVSSPGSARYVPPGAGGSTSPQVESASYPIDTAKTYYACGWIRPDTANKPLYLGVNWYTSGSVYVSTTTVVVASPVAAAWHFLELVVDPSTVPTAARAAVGVGENATPATADAFYADDLMLQVYDPTVGVRVAADSSPTAAVNDWGPASGVAYEYRWVAVGANGTSIASPWVS